MKSLPPTDLNAGAILDVKLYQMLSCSGFSANKMFLKSGLGHLQSGVYSFLNVTYSHQMEKS